MLGKLKVLKRNTEVKKQIRFTKPAGPAGYVQNTLETASKLSQINIFKYFHSVTKQILL